jgi:hypothetical protein
VFGHYGDFDFDQLTELTQEYFGSIHLLSKKPALHLATTR